LKSDLRSKRIQHCTGRHQDATNHHNLIKPVSSIHPLSFGSYPLEQAS